MASQLKNQLHTYPPGASETGCAYPYCPDPIANNIVLDDLNAVIDQTNLSNEIQQLLAVGLPAQSALAPEYYHIVCDQEYVDPSQLSGIVADFCLCYEDPELAASQHIDCELLSDVYWYHPGYLGSNELITDITGEPYQYFFYTPFGETILQEDAFNASYDNPWRFNGKELDPETGNYYYGARYYNPTTSIWLSVDPKAHWYPDHSPYNFSLNNPINLVDPNGQWVEGAGFWRNVFSSDEKILAENLAAENGGEAFKHNGVWRASWTTKNNESIEGVDVVFDDLHIADFDKGVKRYGTYESGAHLADAKFDSWLDANMRSGLSNWNSVGEYCDQVLAPEIAFWVGEMNKNYNPVMYFPNGVSVLTRGKTLFEEDATYHDYTDASIDLIGEIPKPPKIIGPLGHAVDFLGYFQTAAERYGKK